MIPFENQAGIQGMIRKNIDKLITEALAIEAEEAKQAGAIGFMARALT